MDPYTPRAQLKSRKKKNITLSAKEYTKITGTIASVRRTRLQQDDFDDDRRHNHSRSRDTEPSFIAETSFVRAPLNSRVSMGAAPAISKGKEREKQENIDRLSIDIQEALILEDLLYVLMGIEGTHITFHPEYSEEDDDPLQGIRFAVTPLLDTSLRDLVERILPLGTYYTAISSFIELRSHLDYGMVNHALCAAMREMLKDYQTLLSQLEHSFQSSPLFSLQKLWFYVHPTIHTLSLLYQLVIELGNAEDPSADLSSSSSSDDESIDAEEEERNEALGLGGAKLKAVLSEMNMKDLGGEGSSGIPVKGGEVLAIIYDRQQSLSGDPTATVLYATLLKEAGRPYVGMLKTWITTGKLADPYEELMVKESRFINRGILESDYTDEYWERRYTLRDGSTLQSSNPGKRQNGLSDNPGVLAGVPAPRPAAVGGRLPGGACIPPLLESWKHKILLAGKYLNVIRECGIEVARHDQKEDTDFSMDDERFYKFLENAYTYANRTLVQLLLKDQQLIPRLRSLKRYFFLSHSSFLTHLLDLSHSELRKPAKSANIIKLQSLLDLALNADSNPNITADDSADGGEFKFKEDVKVVLNNSGLYEWLLKVVSVSGVIGEEGAGDVDEKERKDKDKDDKKPPAFNAIDALTLDYTVKFPLSLVISRKTILRYQLIFRFLLNLKHLEQSLSAMWVEQKTALWRRPLPYSDDQPPSATDFNNWRLRVFLLRTRMLSFVQQILAFATFEVLEPNWRKLEEKLRRVETVDQLLRDHVDFLDGCLKECMLTSSKLLKAYSRMMYVCSTFASYNLALSKSAAKAMSADSATEDDMTPRWVILGKFETNFNHWFRVYLDCVQFYASSENVSLLPLVVRLNGIKNAS